MAIELSAYQVEEMLKAKMAVKEQLFANYGDIILKYHRLVWEIQHLTNEKNKQLCSTSKKI